MARIVNADALSTFLVGEHLYDRVLRSVLRNYGVVFNQVDLKLARGVNEEQEVFGQSNESDWLILVSLRESPVVSILIIDLMKGDLPVSENSCPRVVHDCLLNRPEVVPLVNESDHLKFSLLARLSPPVVID